MPYPLDYPADVIAGDLLIAQITINDRGDVTALTLIEFDGVAVEFGGVTVEF